MSGGTKDDPDRLKKKRSNHRETVEGVTRVDVTVILLKSPDLMHMYVMARCLILPFALV